MRSVTLPGMLMVAMSITSCTATSADAASGVRFAAHGVTAWVGDTTYVGEPNFFQQATWSELAIDALPESLTGHPVLKTKTAIVAFSTDGSRLTFWTRRGSRATRRGEITLDATGGPRQFRFAPDQRRSGIAVEIRSTDGRRQHVVVLSADGILEIRQPADKSVRVASRMQHVLAPSLIGTDLLYAAADLAPAQPCYVPSLNMAVGLLADGDCMLVAVWPPGQQTARLRRSPESQPPTIEAFSLDTAGQSMYLAFLDHPGIWHEESLKGAYLEKNTPIGWRRPFEARWIGRFFIESENYAFPFYFLHEPRHLWGRYIRGWFDYPVWFDGDRTMVHFEKKFPPKGRLLIYYLDGYQSDVDMLSPFGVMRRTLGSEQTDRLLDFAGANALKLLAHHNAVCAMTRQIEDYFASSRDAELRLRVQQFADDVTTFIGLIRDRVFQYDTFAADALSYLETQGKTNRSVAADAETIVDLLEEIRLIAKEDLPESSLDEVRAWTDQIKQLVGQARDGDLAKVKAVTQRCRSVAGTQDDMARNLSILTIQLMEEAARMGTKSPEHVRLAEQLIARSRAVLRQPTWWEPYRKYEPKSNPGQP